MVEFRSQARDYVKAGIVLLLAAAMLWGDLSGRFGLAEQSWY